MLPCKKSQHVADAKYFRVVVYALTKRLVSLGEGEGEGSDVSVCTRDTDCIDCDGQDLLLTGTRRLDFAF
jgi:hypothetical protein